MKKKTLKDVPKFTVKRKKWFRGKGSWNSNLLNSSGNMCCLGFYALACGFEKSDIIDKLDPTNIIRHIDCIWKTKLLDKFGNSAACYDLMSINDEGSISDKEREAKLKTLFKKMGVAVTFKD